MIGITVGTKLSPLFFIPAVRIYGGVFFGCTFRTTSTQANEFDADPSLSCWSGWWWAYATVVGTLGLGFVMFSASSSLQASFVGREETTIEGTIWESIGEPTHPSTVAFACTFIFLQVSPAS